MVAADVVQRAAAGPSLVPPAHRGRRAAPVVGPVSTAEVQHSTEHAAADQVPDVGDAPGATEGEADPRQRFRFSGEGPHRTGVLQGVTHRLLAVNGLAGLQQTLHHFTVQGGDHDADHVDVVGFGDRLPGRVVAVVAEAAWGRLPELGVHVPDRDESDRRQRRLVDGGRGPVRGGMRATRHPRADDGDSQAVPHAGPFWTVRCLERSILEMRRGRAEVPPRPTIYDVAQRAGASKSLASLVLRNAPHVSQKRREAVLSAIAELGYRPSSAASSLAGNRTRSIGVAIDDFDEGIVLAMETGGSTPDLGGVPVVVAGARVVPPGADFVADDDVEGARLATQHLLGLGHRTIGHLTGAGGIAALRRESYEAIMAEAGLPVVVTGSGGTTEEDGYVATRAMLDARHDTTGIFAANDVMLLGALPRQGSQIVSRRVLLSARLVRPLFHGGPACAPSRMRAVTSRRHTHQPLVYLSIV